MAYNASQTRTWGTTTPASGNYFEAEFNRIYANTAYFKDAPTFDGIVTLGAGKLKFPATQSASSDANTLDDYEEGSWSPNFGGNATYDIQVGRYVKIGNAVFCKFRVKVNTLGTGSAVTLQGLPFTSNSDSNSNSGISIGYFGGLALSVVFLSGYVNTGGTTVPLMSITAAGAILANNSVIGNGAELIGNIFYTV